MLIIAAVVGTAAAVVATVAAGGGGGAAVVAGEGSAGCSGCFCSCCCRCWFCNCRYFFLVLSDICAVAILLLLIRFFGVLANVVEAGASPASVCYSSSWCACCSSYSLLVVFLLQVLSQAPATCHPACPERLWSCLYCLHRSIGKRSQGHQQTSHCRRHGPTDRGPELGLECRRPLHAWPEAVDAWPSCGCPAQGSICACDAHLSI